MARDLLLQPQQTYIPAVAITRATLKHSWGRIPVATSVEPETVCGEARRIGYTGKGENDLALYRLKIKPNKGVPTMTLPSVYIVDNGTFTEYEQ